MAKTKKDATMTLVTDLFVKLSNLYNDAYVVKGSFIIAGEEPSTRILGSLMCNVETKYKDALKELVGEKPCFYIPSIPETKKWLQGVTKDELEPTEEIKEKVQEFIKEVSDKELIEKQVQTISEFENKFYPTDLVEGKNPIYWWSCLGENAELVETIFSLKRIFDYPIETKPENADTPQSEKTYMTISKQLLPLVTEKTVQDAYIGTTGVRHGKDDELLEVMVDFRFSHFRMMIIYNLVVLPWMPDVQLEKQDS